MSRAQIIATFALLCTLGTLLLWRAQTTQTAADEREAALERQLSEAVRTALADGGRPSSGPILVGPEDAGADAYVAVDLEALVHRVVQGGVYEPVDPGEMLDAGGLAELRVPPPPGLALKSFHRLPRAPVPDAFMYWVVGAARYEDVMAHYLAAAKKIDPEAEFAQHGSFAKLRSEKAHLDVMLSRYEDTVSAQVTYGDH